MPVDYVYYMRPFSLTKEDWEKTRKLMEGIKTMCHEMNVEIVIPAKAPEPVSCPGEWVADLFK